MVVIDTDYNIQDYYKERYSMAFSNIDRTGEVASCKKEISVESTDFCSFYKKHPDTFLQRKECWTCKYVDFGLENSIVTDTGICRFQNKKI